LILAPRGRDALVARGILREAHLHADICTDLFDLAREIARGADVAIVTEEATREPNGRPLVEWIAAQPPWSDFPFVVLTGHGGGLERNPTAAELAKSLGNVALLERPFHPTTLVSMVQSSLRSRRRQYECKRLNEELEIRVNDRTSELAAANRQLLRQIEERERVETTLRQMQRLEAVGQLTSGVAHDFNNLLTVVLGNIGFLERDFAASGVNGKSAQRLSYMRSAAERGAKLTDQLLSFSRRQRLEPRSLDLNETVVSMRDLLQSTMGGSIQIETSFQDKLWPAMVDPTQLELAILNLAINARDAMEVGGTLTVSTANITLGEPRYPEEPPPGAYVAVCVSDTGTGMDETVRRKVFEPFFTTKEIGKGSGLGLSQVLGFAQQSSGGICLESHLGKGTRVHLYLPRSAAQAERPNTVFAGTNAPALANGSKVLLVDDDSAVREVTAAMLRDLGYEVFEAGSGGGAFELLDRERVIDLIVMDFAMPGMNGAEVARQARISRPTIPILFITGFADRGAISGIDGAQIIGKPFSRDELADKITQVLCARRDRLSA
jgi:signal transduction histidine kinase